MPGIRRAAVANMFYPGSPDQLHADIQNMLSASDQAGPAPKAIVVPHAGYIYSGQVAASAYARLIPVSKQIRRVILLGPCHRVPLSGLATSTADYFETPLGQVPLDCEAIARIMPLNQVRQFDLTHQQEHSLEVQLPFLQEVLENFSLVPLVVGDASAEDVQQVLDILWGGNETLIVISSDLSHYHDYYTAREMDAATSRAIESLDGGAIQQDQACGRMPLLGLLQCAKNRQMKVTTLELKNSGDTAGSKDQVVGYGAWALEE